MRNLHRSLRVFLCDQRVSFEWSSIRSPPKRLWLNWWVDVVFLHSFLDLVLGDSSDSPVVVLMSSDWHSVDRSSGLATSDGWKSNYLLKLVRVLLGLMSVVVVVYLLILKSFFLILQRSFLPMFHVLPSENCLRWNRKLPSSGEKFRSDRKKAF